MSSNEGQAGHCTESMGRTKLLQLLHQWTQVHIKMMRLTRARHKHEGHSVLSLAPLLCRQIIAAAANETGVEGLLSSTWTAGASC